MDHGGEVKRVTARSKDMYDSGGGSGGEWHREGTAP
jgi:hypothetical protein